MTVADFERLGVFYMGRTAEGPYLYESNHLVTHAVVIGMTGSGKTGLSIGLLEEAAIDGVPAIVVDPKGDLGNLLLTFPGLTAEEVAPWAPAGADPAAEAARWAEGIGSFGQDAARIARLKAAADFAIYTPGSRAGRPLSIVGSLAAPSAAVRADSELLSERVTQVAASLLQMAGVVAEAGKSREHVLVSTILQRAWSVGESLDLAGLVARIQDPPFDRVGVIALDSFFPDKDRFELALAFNALIASPGFDAWLAGEPLDVERLLWTSAGKPRVSILSIAHLGDAERMFFVSLLLGQIVAWMRTQPGTPSLRALFFMDEIFGYFPPVAVPPSKPPLLTLLKQARAYGLGIVLATQNPVDLDYKGLANTGTWMVGRLQTERDKARLLDGLEGVAGGRGFDRGQIDAALSALPKRHFYVHDVHAPAPVVIESRWTLSYLRGPLTREEIKRLAAPPAGVTAPLAAEAVPASGRPVLPPGITEVFLPTTKPRPTYRAWVLGAARVHIEDAKSKLDFTREVVFLAPVSDGPIPLRWEDAVWAGPLAIHELPTAPAPDASFVPPASAMLDPKRYPAWTKELLAWLGRTQGIARFKSAPAKLISEPGEDERAFRARLAQVSREARDAAAATIRDKYRPKFEAIEEKIRNKQQSIAAREEQARGQGMDVAVALGSGILGAFLGGGARRAVSGAAATARSAGRASRGQKTVEREREDLAALMTKYGALQEEAKAALAKATALVDPATAPLETVVSKPKKTGVAVQLVALAWKADG